MGVLEQLFQALALIGAGVLAILVYRMVARDASGSPEVPAGDDYVDSLRESIQEAGRREDKAITDALNSGDPAGDLARRGDERRG